ncbi:MAG: formylglycine-generating enzyme family protein, partial [Planctomycetes bacterium]|nr:formylglycine-generating enzyme family protein [Planctomycetota bacterium]
HGPTGIAMVLLPGGTFLMGSAAEECGREADEAPVHEVRLSPFLISKHEVSQARWEAVMGTNPSVFQAGLGLPEGVDTDDLPVDSVSFDDALLFADRTGLSLPTEAQWEFACRGGTRTPFAFGSAITTDQVNFSSLGEDPCEGSGTARLETVAVDSFVPNAYGLFNMHGNVAEWCADRYDPDFYSSPRASGPDPISISGSGATGRVVRGGSWGGQSHLCRSASRVHAMGPPGSTAGLRVVWRQE